ncbi:MULTISPECIES: LIC_13387 family protein [Leptospira]|uniref:LIC_13387 family protein n=1 Tax=Leptospira TaxID=171 RepID=UPI0002BFA410|nr:MULTISPECIES: hypothetical protein [Leptospira]EMK06035.1 hypothetical protein LEP1GSC166_0142 [Leptospira kirschneri]KXZ28352.1 hypothetical protein AYB32_00050 [Leptospira kirschneri]KXZ31123.1 hypothetical protein AYB34_01380 [Leptospira sp. ZV016]
MKAKLFIRIASALMFVFALGHSFGHFTRYETSDSQALNAISIMQQTKIPMEGVTKTYDQFYTGMSLNLSIVLISLTLLLWILSNFSESNPQTVQKLLIPILFCIFCFGITGFTYFFFVPAIVASLGAISVLVGIILLGKG